MKKFFLTVMYLLLTCISFYNFSFAQTAYTPANGEWQEGKITGFTATGLNEKNFIKVPKTYVTTKALRSFIQLFGDASEAQWYNLKNYYLAEFSKNGNQTKALFAKNGYIYYTLTYGTEKDLPAEARKLIKSNYVDYHIGCVRDVYSLGQKAWIINLQHDDHLVIVRLADRILDVLDDTKLHPVFKVPKNGKLKL